MRLTRELLHREEVYHLVGCAFEVHKTLGHGFYEKAYENALVVECRLRGISISQQSRYDIIYKDHQIGQLIPDLVAFDSIVVEAKTIEAISDLERGQLLNYLKATNLKVGLILNFKKPKLQWERLVRSQ